jgi:hypothetical protein
MDKQSRRDAIRDFKERVVTRGVVAVRCAPTGQAWVAVSRNLDQQENSLWFGLRQGSYVNRDVQAAWNVHGEAGLTYEVLEVFDDEEMTPIGRADLAKSRLAYWLAELGAKKLVG